MAAQSQGRSGRAKGKLSPSPKSTHTTDPFLQNFLDPAFDPASYINATLPPLAPPKSGPGRQQAGAPLAEVSSEAQALLLQLNTHTTRLSGVLTQLADEILRSGSRLAYEVELLRGEALSLEETMTEKLQGEIEMFVPGGLRGQQKQQQQQKEEEGQGDAGRDPVFIEQLHTLTLVRARLDSVIKTFGEAMEFVFPPSEISLSSGFLSVSAPEPGSTQQSSEEKGHEVLKALREEVSGLLHRSEDPVQGIERAAERVQGLKELATVWKGTAEEKGRARFIEGLAKMVEDRHRNLLREAEQTRREGEKQGRTGDQEKAGGSQAAAATAADDGRLLPGGFGLMSQLQKLRSGL
ncbi:hypothetical protein ESCO_001939 [Escovopsis weberi]|uniref:Uncharacterized protein n=1 Tax=Escovopsis weberi TaxID=150374 RepID=A0A0M8N976_ESCWE|nr:hypothetical protein ESCO_001939 [Escovopsis weberi]